MPSKTPAPKKAVSGDPDDICPGCHADLTGEPIPEKSRHLYNHSHFSQRIGIYDRALDRTSHWKCPKCKHMWKRK